MPNEHDIRYVVSLSLEQVASGCEQTIKIRTSEVCPSCNGSGRSSTPDSTACPSCRGTGETYQALPTSVRIPAGVKDGCQLRVETRGQIGEKGESPKRLSVVVSIRAHKIFQRHDDDIIYELPLNFAQAALGAEVMVPTLQGNVAFGIPAGTQTGEVFRLKRKGIPHFGRRGRGDQLIKVRVVTPTSLDESQRRRLERLAKSLPQAESRKPKNRKQGNS